MINFLASRPVVLSTGLPKHESCLKCTYGGVNHTVNYCRLPKDDHCRKHDIIKLEAFK